MESRKGNDCGVVTILMQNGVIFQGTIIGRDANSDFFPSERLHWEDRPEFLFLELRCFPALLRDNAEIRVINPPLYQPNNTVKINVAEIASIGPSGACLEQEENAT